MSKPFITFFMAGSGGLGVSATCRAAANSLGLHGLQTILVDAAPRRQDQRRFHGIGDRRGLETAAVRGIAHTIIMPPELGTAYALLPGPNQPGAPGVNDLYGESLWSLMGSADAIVADAGTVTATDWDDPHSFAGNVIRPYLDQNRARIVCTIGQERVPQAAGLDLLAAISRRDRIAVVGQCGIQDKPIADRDWVEPLTELADRFAGTDRWTVEARDLIDKGQSGTPSGDEPKWLKRICTFSLTHERQKTYMEHDLK